MRNGLSVCALYHDLLNIYADRGNLLVLERRCRWRGIPFSLRTATVGDPLPRDANLFYIGGGQDRDQLLCAEDLLERKAEPLREAVAEGAVVLAVCGGYQLLGEQYDLGLQRSLEGVGIFRARTVRGPQRLIGNVALEPLFTPYLERSKGRLLVGFENHAGRTLLAAEQPALGAVRAGHGNDGESGLEGAVTANAFGTYLHGPLLPKNSWFADELIARALCRHDLPALQDELEEAAHKAALAAAGER